MRPYKDTNSYRKEKEKNPRIDQTLKSLIPYFYNWEKYNRKSKNIYGLSIFFGYCTEENRLE